MAFPKQFLSPEPEWVRIEFAESDEVKRVKNLMRSRRKNRQLKARPEAYAKAKEQSNKSSKRMLDNLKKDPEKYKIFRSKTSAQNRKLHAFRRDNEPGYVEERRLAANEASKTERAKELNRKRSAKRRSTPMVKLNSRMSSSIGETLRGNKNRRHWCDLVGYTGEQLMTHIQSQFTDGMTMDKFMSSEIEIDHNRPIASFIFSTPDDPQFKECWAMENLQPRWKVDNRVKSSFYNGKQWRYTDHQNA